MSIYPQAPMWLPPYPPSTPHEGTKMFGGNEEEFGDNIERIEILGGNEDIEPTQILNPDDEGEKTVELNDEDDDMDDD